ncbi:hypothetical protein CH267_06395 [Rhodococcus sp. 06-621-2]|nr:hypothetical protein CH267_06395 [Rhodococcus sp. 06-621-2]
MPSELSEAKPDWSSSPMDTKSSSRLWSSTQGAFQVPGNNVDDVFSYQLTTTSACGDISV